MAETPAAALKAAMDRAAIAQATAKQIAADTAASVDAQRRATVAGKQNGGST